MIAAFLASILIRQSPNTQLKIWQKWVAPGLSYYMEYEPAGPRVVQALRVNLDSAEIRPIAELADHVVFDDNPDQGLAPVSAIVKMDHALAGINGDFFPFKGNPLNLMVRDGEIIALPYQEKAFATAKRPIFGWGLHHAEVGFAKTSFSITPDGKTKIEIGGFNEGALHNNVTLDSQSAGLALAKSPNAFAVIQLQSGKWNPDSKLRGEVIETGDNLTKRAVLPGTAVVIGEDSGAAQIAELTKGDEVNISIQTSGFDWTHIKNAVGGACTLLVNGKVSIDSTEARLDAAFVNMRHPRSAVGIDKQGHIWLVAVDGRTTVSIGATLQEMAKIMQSFGCVSAINLDGGGSTTLDVLGLTMNHPSDGAERPIANAIVVLGTRPSPGSEVYSLKSPTTFRYGTPSVVLNVTRSDGSTVPPSEVFWQGSGAGWIDEGGNVHILRTGTLVVTAMVHGEQLSERIKITPSK